MGMRILEMMKLINFFFFFFFLFIEGICLGNRIKARHSSISPKDGEPTPSHFFSLRST